MLKVDDVYSGYGLFEVLRGVSLQVNRGEVVVLLGSNGAGKSTLLRTVVGLVKATRGSVCFGDVDLQRCPPSEVVNIGVALVPEGRLLFPKLTVRENLLLGGYCARARAQIPVSLRQVFERFPILRERSRQQAGSLSGGQQQMLAIARALMARPTVLLLDEPSLGVAPVVVDEIFQIIKDLRTDGTTILLVEQSVDLALAVCDRAYVLETGKIVLEGTAKEVRENPQIRQAYLGGLE